MNGNSSHYDSKQQQQQQAPFASNGGASSPLNSNSPTVGAGTKRFDPFAPLNPSPSQYHSTPTSSRGSAPSTPPQPSSATGGAFSSNSSLARNTRPSSLYIPMDDPATPPKVNEQKTWPFTDDALSAQAQAPPSTSFPLSPSLIHPSYAEPSSANPSTYSTSGANGYATPPPPAPPVPVPNAQPSHQLYSAIPVGASTAGGAPTSSREPSPLPNRRSAGMSTSNAKYGGDTTPPRHSQNYSLGTHALLSPRAPASSRLAQQLDTPVAWLVLYFGFNLGLTLFNKLVMQGFPFPWTLTAIQMLSGTIGTQIALQQGYFTQARLSTKESITMVAFSFLYTVNIAVSNLSLHLVTVPFHQVVRAMTPLFTIIISAVWLHKRHSRDTYLSLLPVVAGVAFATYGDYSCTAWGFILTLLGTLLAAMKTIITNRVQVGRLKLHPLDLLIRMSPLAFMQCVFFGWTTGELDRVRIYGATEMTQRKAISLIINGAIAFGLNVVSFTANKKTSALTMTVAANVKQVLTIILAVLIFNLSLNPTNIFGITLTLAGGAWYARVELLEKTRNNAAAAANRANEPLLSEKN